MKRLALVGGVAALMAFGVPAISLADTTLSTTSSGETDAGSLINKRVVDSDNQTVGTIDSVLVNASGKVDAVVIDVSSWLESKKLVSVPWNEMKVDSKGNIETSLTKASAQQAADAVERRDVELRTTKALLDDALHGGGCDVLRDVEDEPRR